MARGSDGDHSDLRNALVHPVQGHSRHPLFLGGWSGDEVVRVDPEDGGVLGRQSHAARRTSRSRCPAQPGANQTIRQAQLRCLLRDRAAATDADTASRLNPCGKRQRRFAPSTRVTSRPFTLPEVSTHAGQAQYPDVPASSAGAL